MRRKKTKRQKNEENKRRFEAIKDLMSTFAMSTVAVVATVTLIPASPKAEILKTVALSEEIVYQVNVTDEDNALDESTLFVVLENQLEYYEEPIELGENTGYFENLEADTQYRLSVYGNKGFGQERLDTVLVTTRATVGGTILSVIPQSDGHHGSIYTVDVSIYDPDSKYTSINLYYGYSWEPDQELTYTSIPITTDREEIILNDIWTDYPFHIYLEGTTVDGTELLDEIWVTPPYMLFAEAYLAYKNATEIKYHVYGDSSAEGLHYIFNVYKNELLLKSETYHPDPEDHHAGYLITDLLPESTYMIEVVAVYTNPQTLAKEKTVITSEEVTTTLDYSYTYHIETFDTYLEVTINLDDPNDIFQFAYYETYDTSEEFEMFIESMSYPFELNGDEKTIIITINIPDVTTYKIYLGMNNELDHTINKIIETYYSEEEE